MFAVPRNRIAAVHRRVAMGREKIRLPLAGPMHKKLLLAPVEFAHFLQADQVRIQTGNRLAQVVNL